MFTPCLLRLNDNSWGGAAVPKRVRTEHTYDIGADRLWACCVSYGCLAHMMSSLASYEGLPDREMQVGDDLTLQVTHFKFTRPMEWTVSVVERNDDKRVLRTSEKGGAIRSYFHSLLVEDLGNGSSRLIDDIVFDAGWLSWPLMWWIRHIYKTRDAPRRDLLGLSGADPVDCDILPRT